MIPEELLEQERKAAGAALAEQTHTPEYSSAADFDARLTRMLMEDERKEREKQEKRIQRQQMAQSLTDLGAVFGDVIKASGGALVTPRDMQAKYDALDKRQQTVYNNYRARMDVLREKAMQRAKADRDAAQRAKEREESLQLRRDLADQNDEYKRWKTEQDNAARIKNAEIRASKSVTTRTLPSGEQELVVEYAGQPYSIKKKVYDSRIAQLYAYLKRNNLFSKAYTSSIPDFNNVFALVNSNQSMADETTKAKLANAVLVSIADIPASDEHSADIIAILQGTYGQSTQTTQTAQQTAGQQKQKKPIRGVNGN